MDLIEARDSVGSRADLVRFVSMLRDDLLANEESWENPSLDLYLEALGAWVKDMDGYFRNQNTVEPPQPSWRLVAQILFAASVYE